MNNYLKLALLLVFVLQVHALTCGSNCPSNTCDNCICGTAKSSVSSANCSKYAWNQNCCKCIVTKISTWNKHYMTKAFSFLEVGLFGIDEDDAEECNMSTSSLCNYGDNLKCAYEQYVDFGKTWAYWDY